MKAIVAVDEHWGIGKGGKLLCPLSADLRRFKTLTLGHPVILGRKTLSTFPGGRPLPGRRNLILSRDPAFQAAGAEIFSDREALLAAAPDDSIVIGGESIYKMLLDVCDTVWVTRIFRTFDADARFPDLDSDPAWTASASEPPLEENVVPFQYVTYLRHLRA